GPGESCPGGGGPPPRRPTGGVPRFSGPGVGIPHGSGGAHGPRRFVFRGLPVARMERSAAERNPGVALRMTQPTDRPLPHFASLHAGYDPRSRPARFGLENRARAGYFSSSFLMVNGVLSALTPY